MLHAVAGRVKQQHTCEVLICELKADLQVALDILQVCKDLGRVVVVIMWAGRDDPLEDVLCNLQLPCIRYQSIGICDST